MSRTEPTTPKQGNSCSRGAATSAGILEVASCDLIKKDYIIKVVPCPLILDAANIVYPYGSTDVFQNEYLFSVPIQWEAAIYNGCRHICSSLPFSFEAALWCHHCESKVNRHPKG